MPGYPQLGHDDQEHEQVVDRQRVLREPAAEELHAVPSSADHRHADAEQHRGADEERQVARRLAGARLMRRTPDVEDVDDQECDRQSDRDRPDPRLDVHATSGALAYAFAWRARVRPEVSPTRAGRLPGAVAGP